MVASRQAVMDFLTPYCSSDLEEIDILVALQEALANAVFHGCKNDFAKTIYCSVAIDLSGFKIVVRDPGPGFDVEAVARSADGGVNASEHGRGICLMRSLMDDVTYGRGGAEVCLRKLRGAGRHSLAHVR
jgi:serine/threonine-protein kinase RsbW